MNDAHGKTITAKQMQLVMVPKKNDAPKGNINAIDSTPYEPNCQAKIVPFI